MLELDTVGSLAWLIPASTALAFVIAVAMIVAGAGGRATSRIVVLSILTSALFSLVVFVAALRAGGAELAQYPFIQQFSWLPMGQGTLSFGILLDPLSVSAVTMVALVCSAIFVFSTGYMEGEFTAYRDPVSGTIDAALGSARFARFFAFVALFATGMLGFVLASNLLQALLFWEIMGLCSFLLIGFWYHKPTASAAAIKAFLTTRIGDMFLLVGLFVLYGVFGTVDYATMLSADGVQVLRGLGVIPVLHIPVATIIALLVFGGAVGKSAQFPLHVWLPDAMEGPTPVSALIHAATMVSAGVFLVARMYPLFSAQYAEGPGDISGAMFVVASIGALTAIFAATIGVAQFDVKRVLAFSTISQLGYMVMALGIGAYVAAVFHLIAHAFFKALLFLGSGSVIHGVEHGMHHAHDVDHHAETDGREPAPDAALTHRGAKAPTLDPHDPQDMRNMGALRERMPFTFLAFLAGALALTGVPLFAGFWSKDEILAVAFYKGVEEGILMAGIVWVLGTMAAFLTAFYMARQVFMVFAGPPSTEGARHAPESDMRMVGPLLFLAAFAVLLGFVGVPAALPGLGPLLGNPFHHFVGALPWTGAHFTEVPFTWVPMIISVIMAFTGWGLGWVVYGRRPATARAHDPLQRLGPIWTLLYRKYYIDELYGVTVIPFTKWLGSASAWIDTVLVDGTVNMVGRVGYWSALINGWIDTHIVDGVVNLFALVLSELGIGFRRLQSGRVQQYLLVLFVSVLALLVAFMV